MDYSVLKAEVGLPAYSGMTDQQIRDALNIKNIPVKKTLDTRDIQKYLMLSGLWITIKTGTSASSIVATEALNLFDSFELSDPLVLNQFTEIIDGLVADVTTPDFIAGHKEDLLAMADSYISRAEQLGLPEIKLWHLQEV